MVEYPFSGPIILDDYSYVNYGGWTGTSTALQRSNAYWMAEMQVSFHIGTLLLPTNVTGTFAVPRFGYPVVTDWGEVSSLGSVIVFAKNSWYTCNLAQITGCGYIRENTYGYIDISCIYQYAAASILLMNPYQVQVGYTCGFDSGTSMQPPMMQALTWAADLNLKDMISPTSLEGGAGDPGIQEFSLQSYAEKRTLLSHTDFGSGPRANKIKRFLTPYVRTPGLMLARL